MTLRAISLWQPYASVVAEGAKWVETRPFPYPWRSAVGLTVAIHATAGFDGFTGNLAYLGEWTAYRTAQHGSPVDGPAYRKLGGPMRPLPLGAIVATARLVAVVPMIQFHSTGPGHEPTFPWTPYDGSALPPFPMLALNHDVSTLTLHRGQLAGGLVDVTDQKPYGVFAPGRSALIFDEIVKCVPVPCRGHQGLWIVPPDIADNLLGWAA